jgi:hypothetical protein
MFNLVRPVVDYQGTLYIIKRTIKEANIPEENVQEYKKFLGCDSVLKKEGMYYFVNKIEEAQIVTEDIIELTES